MKSQSTGLSPINYLSPIYNGDHGRRVGSGNLKKAEFTGFGWGESYNPVPDYIAKRGNGCDADSPSTPFPNDGIYTWETPNAATSKVLYTEGPEDRAWMKERDRIYLGRLGRGDIRSDDERRDAIEQQSNPAFLDSFRTCCEKNAGVAVEKVLKQITSDEESALNLANVLSSTSTISAIPPARKSLNAAELTQIFQALLKNKSVSFLQLDWAAGSTNLSGNEEALADLAEKRPDLKITPAPQDIPEVNAVLQSRRLARETKGYADFQAILQQVVSNTCTTLNISELKIHFPDFSAVGRQPNPEELKQLFQALRSNKSVQTLQVTGVNLSGVEDVAADLLLARPEINLVPRIEELGAVYAIALNKKLRIEVESKLKVELAAEKTARERLEIELLEDCKCAKCGKIMINPVLAADGEVYEREEIEKWLLEHDTSPCTDEPLSSKTVISRAAIKRKIVRFMDKHPELWLTDEVYISEKLVQRLIKAVQDRNPVEVAAIVGTNKRLLTRKIAGDQHLLAFALNSASSPEVVQAVVTALDTRFDELTEIKADGGIAFFRIAAVSIGTAAARIIADRAKWQQADIQKQFEFAIESNDTKLAGVCLDLGANLETVDANGSRPLHQVINDGKHDLIRLFIERGALRSAVNDAGNAALHLAILKNDAIAVEILLATKETPRETPDPQPSFIDTLNPQSHLSALHLVLNALQAQPDKDHFTLVQLLISAGANLELPNIEGDTALLQAIRTGNEQLFELVLTRPTSPAGKEAKDSKQNTPLHLALTLDKREFFQKLLAAGVDIDALLPPENDTALLHTVRSNKPELLALILINKPKLEAKDRYGSTALHLAFNLGFLDLIPQLVAAGANLEEKDPDGNTALLRAVKARRLDLAHLMVERPNHHAAINETNNAGENALHIAARQGDTPQDHEMAIFLLDYGVDGLGLNAQDKKPQEVASGSHNRRMATAIDRKILDLRVQEQLGKRQVPAPKVATANKEKFDWLEIPPDFICPITQTLMEKPVVVADGNSYEEEAIEKWLVSHCTSPLDGSMLAHTMLTPNKILKKAIDAFKARLSETQSKRVAEERTRKLGEDFQLAVKLHEEDLENHKEILQAKEECHAAQRLVLEKEVKLGEQALVEKTRTLEIAEKAMQSLLENKEQLEEIEQSQKSLGETVGKIESQLAEKAHLVQENRERQERTLKVLDAKLQELQKVEGLSAEQKTLLHDLLAAKTAETSKAQRRTELLAQDEHPQLKDFYLGIQLLFNRLLNADEMKATGDFATQNTTKKEKAASVFKICGKLVPFVGTALTAASGAVKLYAEKRKQEQAKYSITDLPPNTLSREAMVEEIAFGLCEHYEDQLKALNAGADEERQAAISKLVDTAIQRMHAYLQAQETLEPDPVIALINAVRTKIKDDRKIKIMDKSACTSSAAATSSSAAPTLVPNHWTVHGFFAQSGIRTTTPRRRCFANEASKPADTNKTHTHYTDVKRYGYAYDTEVAATAAGMALRP